MLTLKFQLLKLVRLDPNYSHNMHLQRLLKKMLDNYSFHPVKYVIFIREHSFEI